METLPDGSTVTTYTNVHGNLLLRDVDDGANRWITYHEYDANGNRTLTAHPSAVLGYNAGAANLAVSLRASAGLIDVYEYYTSTTAPEYPTGGSHPLSGGGVEGYLYRSGAKQGAGGPVAWRSETDYVKKTAAGRTVYFTFSSTQYAEAGGAGAETTTYHYTFHPVGGDVTAPVLYTRETILPAVDPAKHGAGTTDSRTDVYDPTGRLVWSRDAAGYLRYSEYDPATGAVTKRIADVDTAQTADFDATYLPGGWSTPAGGGAHLTTTSEADALGRTVKTTGPDGAVSYTVYLESAAATETRTYRGWHDTGGGVYTTTGPVEVYRHDRAGNYTESLTFQWDDAAGLPAANGRPTGDESLTDARAVLQSLSRSLMNDAGQMTLARRYSSLDAVGYSTDRDLGTVGEHYLQTEYTFDPRGRLAVVTDAAGTARHSFFDGQGRVVQTWVGADDVPTTDYNGDGVLDLRDFRYWVAANPGATTGPAGTSMFLVSGSEYDHGGVGDGNLTESRDYFDSGAADYYATRYQYDYRNRMTGVLGPDDVVTLSEYDNLGRTVWSRTYAGADFDVQPDQLRAQSQTVYDARGQVYESRTYEVDPDHGTVGSHLSTYMWYDPRGLAAKSRTGARAFEKTAYDGLGRVVASYVGYDPTEADDDYAAALTVDGDTIFQQTRTWYDGPRSVASATYQRFPGDDSTEGELDATNAFVTGSATWYDLAGRVTHRAYFGREDVLSPIDPGARFLFDEYGALIDANSDGVPDVAQGSPPAGDTLDVIVTQTVYDPRITTAGPIVRTIDNAGRIDEVHSDLLGRTVRTIQNYDDGTASETDTDRDVTVEYEYDFAGRMVTLAALNAKGAGNGVERQETRYLYESAVNGAWQTAVVYPDSTDTLSQGADRAWTVTGGTDHVAIAHDRLGRAVATTDQRGVERVFVYDSAGRLTLDHATGLGDPGHNVDGAVRAFETLYDDIGRVRSITSLGYDAFDEPTVALNQVRYRYDGWGNLVQKWQAHYGEVDTQTTPSVQYVYDDGASGGVAAYVRLHEAIYPNGRTLTYGYGQAGGMDDVLSRITTIATGQDVHAAYAYLGLATIVEEAFTEPEVRLNYDTGSDNSLSGFDRFGRVADQVWEQYGGQQPAAVDRFQYGYDSAGNRVWRKNVVAHGQSLAFDEVYGLDDLGRLIAAERGYLQSVDPVSLTARAFEQDWGLDATGNWAAFNEDLDGTGWDLQQARQHNAANELTGATDWAAPAHDRAGNMTAMPKPAAPAAALDATYDAWNRLVDVSEGGVLIARFSYDAAGRRILQQLADAQEPDRYIHYYHSGQQVVETRAGDDSSGVPDPAQLDPAYQFVWSPRYIDALILRDEYDAQGQLDPGARLFYLADANHNVTALVGLVETEPEVFEWQVVERYVYSPYGDVTIYAPDWSSVLAESAFDNTTLYTGREFDPATGLYYYRARYYHAQLGRFISRDPIGYDAGDVNLYRYVGNGPLARVDPSGLRDSPLGPTSDVVVGTLAGQQVSVAARFVTTIGGDRYYYTLNPAKQLNPVTTETSTFFIYKGTDPGANNVFRLDFHPLKKKGPSVWHTNVGGEFKQLRRLDHATSPRITAAGRTITIFKRAGRPLFVLGVAASAVDVYYAEDRPREITKKVSGYAGAWAGAKGGAWYGAKLGVGIALVAGQMGPQVATPEEIVTVPAAGAAGGMIGGIVGGIYGFWAGETAAEYVWDTWLFPIEKEEWVVCEPPTEPQTPRMDTLQEAGIHFGPF